MAERPFYQRVVPPLLWVAVIAILSEPVFSYAHSLEILERATNSITDRLSHHAAMLVVTVLRKSAHAIEYGILAGFLWPVFAPGRFRPLERITAILLLVFIAACMDEMRQTGMAGRIGQFSDALIDLGGGILAVALMQLRTQHRKPI
jgi:VanZ family protein